MTQAMMTTSYTNYKNYSSVLLLGLNAHYSDDANGTYRKWTTSKSIITIFQAPSSI